MPFFVKKMVLLTALKPQPTTSPVEKVGPYWVPVADELNTHPSSAWYPNEFFSQPDRSMDRWRVKKKNHTHTCTVGLMINSMQDTGQNPVKIDKRPTKVTH